MESSIGIQSSNSGELRCLYSRKITLGGRMIGSLTPRFRVKLQSRRISLILATSFLESGIYVLGSKSGRLRWKAEHTCLFSLDWRLGLEKNNSEAKGSLCGASNSNRERLLAAKYTAVIYSVVGLWTDKKWASSHSCYCNRAEVHRDWLWTL